MEKKKKNNCAEENEELKCGIKENEEAEAVDGEDTSTDTPDMEMENLKKEMDEKTRQCNDYMNMLQRTAAEFDNYKKRTTREKEALYSDTVSEVISAFLPVVDNFERAVQVTDSSNKEALREGIEMVLKQMKDTMKRFGVEEIKSIGEKFDPNLHNAVMHVDDEGYGENEVIEELQKGYLIKDKVIRYSMVKVAN